MTPLFANVLQRHREVTNTALHLNHAKKTCKGECRRSRSVGQFRPGQEICIRCMARRKA